MSENHPVASLDAETEAQATPTTKTKTEDIDYEAKALNYLKRGVDRKKIVQRLMRDGMGRAEAVQLTTRVWEDGASTRRTNAMILIITASIMLILGGLDLFPRMAAGTSLPLFAPSYALIPIGAIILATGLGQYKQVGRK